MVAFTGDAQWMNGSSVTGWLWQSFWRLPFLSEKWKLNPIKVIVVTGIPEGSSGKDMISAQGHNRSQILRR